MLRMCVHELAAVGSTNTLHHSYQTSDAASFGPTTLRILLGKRTPMTRGARRVGCWLTTICWWLCVQSHQKVGEARYGHGHACAACATLLSETSHHVELKP